MPQGGMRITYGPLGEGPFQTNPLCDALRVHVISIVHGVICPDAVMLFDAYEAALQATRPMWAVDEK